VKENDLKKKEAQEKGIKVNLKRQVLFFVFYRHTLQDSTGFKIRVNLVILPYIMFNLFVNSYFSLWHQGKHIL
jgi:hypothetical protein